MLSTCALKEAHHFTSVSSQSLCCSWSLKGLLVCRMSPVTGQGSSDGRARLVGFVTQLWVHGVIQPQDLVQCQKHVHLLQWLLGAVHELKPELFSSAASHFSMGMAPGCSVPASWGFFPIFVFPTLLIGMPVICTDWILETADPLLAVLLWLGWKVIPGAHPDTHQSLQAELGPCVLCCAVRSTGRAARLPSATLLEQHRAHSSPKRSPNAARHDLAAPPAPACPAPSRGTSPSPLSSIRLLGQECADLGSSQGAPAPGGTSS